MGRCTDHLGPTEALRIHARAAGALPAMHVALIITVLFTWVMVRVAGRIYQGAILRVGGKVSLRDARRGLD